LPTLVERDQIVEGNSKLGVSESLAEIGGPPLGGALVQLISGPLTLLLDALSFVVSALSLARIRTPEPPPAPHAGQQHVLRDLTTGLRSIWASPLLRAFAGSAAVRNFFGWFFGAIYGLYAIRVLGLSTATLGLVVACGGIGGLAGAALVGPLTRRWGIGPTIVGALIVDAAAAGLTWLAGGMLPLAVPLLIVSQLIGDGSMTVALIAERSLRQTITPDRVLGRVNASMNVLGEGIGTLGLLAGGVLAELIGLRPTAGVAALGIAASVLWVVFSPLRRQRGLPPAAE
jgi:predicted MFS family arabinose efflux permease